MQAGRGRKKEDDGREGEESKHDPAQANLPSPGTCRVCQSHPPASRSSEFQSSAGLGSEARVSISCLFRLVDTMIDAHSKHMVFILFLGPRKIAKAKSD